MTYSNEVIIHQPIEKVVELFLNPDNMKHWQDGFISIEQVSGNHGEPGAQSKLRYKMGKREIEMIETVESNKLPEEYTAVYDTKGVWNRQINRFSPVDGDKTKYVSISEFKFTSFMMKLFGTLMPGAFKKQTQKYLDDFKKFAESLNDK